MLRNRKTYAQPTPMFVVHDDDDAAATDDDDDDDDDEDVNDDDDANANMCCSWCRCKRAPMILWTSHGSGGPSSIHRSGSIAIFTLQ